MEQIVCHSYYMVDKHSLVFGLVNYFIKTKNLNLIKNIKILVANPLQFTHNPYKFIYDHKIKKTNCMSLDSYIECKDLDFEIYKQNEREDAILLSSSGTTGIPKVVRLSIDVLLNCSKQLPCITCSDLENKSMLAALPIFHCFGLVMGIVGPIIKKLLTIN